jgi:hypothetical protein
VVGWLTRLPACTFISSTLRSACTQDTPALGALQGIAPQHPPEPSPSNGCGTRPLWQQLWSLSTSFFVRLPQRCLRIQPMSRARPRLPVAVSLLMLATELALSRFTCLLGGLLCSKRRSNLGLPAMVSAAVAHMAHLVSDACCDTLGGGVVWSEGLSGVEPRCGTLGSITVLRCFDSAGLAARAARCAASAAAIHPAMQVPFEPVQSRRRVAILFCCACSLTAQLDV